MPRDLDVLTPAQRAAVTHDRGPLLVLGGPGTGKTRVLVERFAHLVTSGVAPEEILLVGGAPAPVAELRAQVEDALDQPFGELAVHTVPDLAARLLREEPAAVGLDPFFVPVTAADRLALLLDRLDQLTLERHDFLGNRAALLASVIERIDRCKLELVSAADYARWAAELEGAGAEREREFAQLFADHDRLLAEQGTLDVGDLVLRAIELLGDPAAGARCRARFAHVLVDEYEDLDLAHLRLIDLLTEHGDVVVTGDDDAAIKRFRGAATKNLRAFTARRSQARVVALDRSFRSRESILRAARAVVAPVPERLGLT
ncbi:MAG TPA: UvrD-helicase domain-containing protein, partial [Solirubrobacteraceae bacterium]|nr:UvrD-helicase domain-containing protein [Solirubrobacteraceae bacterium]